MNPLFTQLIQLIGKYGEYGEYNSESGSWEQEINVDRTEFLTNLMEKGLPTANAYWPACHQHEVFKPYTSKTNCPISDKFLEQHFSLPMYVELTDEEVKDICEIIRSCR